MGFSFVGRKNDLGHDGRKPSRFLFRFIRFVSRFVRPVFVSRFMKRHCRKNWKRTASSCVISGFVSLSAVSESRTVWVCAVRCRCQSCVAEIAVPDTGPETRVWRSGPFAQLTTEYPAPETYTLRIRGYADTQWSWTTPPPEFLECVSSGYADTQWSWTTVPPEFFKCVGEWIRGYADTQWSWTTPPPEFLECVSEWIRGYADTQWSWTTPSPELAVF